MATCTVTPLQGKTQAQSACIDHALSFYQPSVLNVLCPPPAFPAMQTTVRLVTSQHQAHLRESSKESLLFVARRAQDWKAFVRFRQLK